MLKTRATSTPAGECDMDYSYSQVRPRRRLGNDYEPFEVARRGRHWEVRDGDGQLVCLTVYRRGAAEVIRRLKLDQAAVENRPRPSAM